jgi:hypothetical protein
MNLRFGLEQTTHKDTSANQVDVQPRNYPPASGVAGGGALDTVVTPAGPRRNIHSYFLCANSYEGKLKLQASRIIGHIFEAGSDLCRNQLDLLQYPRSDLVEVGLQDKSAPVHYQGTWSFEGPIFVFELLTLPIRASREPSDCSDVRLYCRVLQCSQVSMHLMRTSCAQCRLRKRTNGSNERCNTHNSSKPSL